MNTPATCPITKTPSWTAQENTNNNTPVNTEVLLLARTPGADHDDQVAGANSAITINIRIRIIAAPGRNNCKQVIDASHSVAVDVRAVRRTLVTDGVAAVVDPAAIDLIRIVPAHHRIRQRGVAVAVDPAAVVGGGVV